MEDIELSKLPTGQLSWAELVRFVDASDDRVERYFLEVKSAVDLNTNAGRSKVAKFILGAANRDQARAASRFGGHAVMLLGVGSGDGAGIASFEAMDLARYVGRVIGADGPSWDFERIPGADGRDVIAVHVAPPTGDVWTCRADADGLRDGAVYVRADGETREATGAELRIMLERLRTKAPDIDLDVSVDGVVHGLIIDVDLVLDAIVEEASRLRELAAPSNSSTYGARFPALASFTRDRRSRAEYLQEVDEWCARATEDPLAGARELASHVRDGIQITITNNTNRYLRGVRIELSFPDPVEALEWSDPDDAKYIATFPDAPKLWGDDYLGDLLPGSFSGPAAVYPRSRHGIARVVSAMPASLVLEMDDLRPRETFVSDPDDIVLALLAAHVEPKTYSGTWSITAEDVHEVFSGSFRTPVEVTDWRKPIAAWYRRVPPTDAN